MGNERAENSGDRPSFLERARAAFQPARFFPSLTAGLITGLIAVTVSAAFAALLFTGELSSYLPAGMGLMLFGSMVVGGLLAWFSSFPGVVGGLQDSTIAVLSLSTLSILQKLPASATPEQKFYTVAAAIALSSLLTGAAFLLLGRFKLGELIRYFPYPVVGGFLAGSGLLLVLGALGVLINRNVTIWELNVLLEPGRIIHWVPGLIFAALLVGLVRRWQPPLLMPAMLLGAAGAVYAGLWVSRTSMDQAAAQGWLLGSFMDQAGSLWRPLALSGLAQVHWPVLLDQLGSLAVVAVVSVITLLLNVTGLELVTGQNFDLNRELKAAGIANLAAGLGGALGGTHTLSDSTLAYKMGARSKVVGLTLACFCALTLFAGGALLEFFPRLVLGGLLLFLGLDFLYTWVVEASFRLSLTDYLTVLLIMLVINTLGLLQGIGVGLAMAVVLFVISYSRIEVVKVAITGRDFQSRVERPRAHQQLLVEHGEWIHILKLQGFLFFGTAHKLLEQVRQRLHLPGQAPPRFMVLDFSHVSGMDASAVVCFVKMLQLARARQVALLFTRLAPEMERQLRLGTLSEGPGQGWRIEADLYHGVEWCEEQVIHQAGGLDYLKPLQALKQQLAEILPEPGRSMSLMEFVLARNEERLDDPASFSLQFTGLSKYLEAREIQAGEALIVQGERPKGLYFLENGQLHEQIEAGGQRISLRSIGAGTLFGEVELYTGQPASSTVTAIQPGLVYHLPAGRLKQMEAEAPEIAAALHKFIAQGLAGRVISTKNALQALMNQ